MSRYVLTQEQLDRLQVLMQQLNRIHNAKRERLRELESYRAHTSEDRTADLLDKIEKLEQEIRELKKANKQLAEEINMDKASMKKINELEALLEEEKKLREYSETFAKQIELKCAEEALIKDLTTELCQLQRAEIELGSQRIEELQRELKNSRHPYHGRSQSQSNNRKEMKQIANTTSRENLEKNKQLKIIIEDLRSYLSALYEEVERKPVRTKEEEARIKEVEKWLKEIGYVMADIHDIEGLRKDLKHLRNEIEYRRNSLKRQN